MAVLTSANVLWEERRWEEATILYRIAACLEDKNEGVSMSYFRAAQWVRRVEEALTFLRKRFDGDGVRSAQPAYSLYEALDALNRGEEALAVLAEARMKRPDDGDLALYHASALIAVGDVAGAQNVLGKVSGVAAPAAWQRCHAKMARQEANNARELEAWRQVLTIEPLAVDAHRSVARLLEHLEGHGAAVSHLREACTRFPFNWQLHEALLDHLREDGNEAVEVVVKDMLRIDPRSAWAWREFALVASREKRFGEAHAALQQSYSIEPRSSSHFSVLAVVLEQESRLDEAREACRRSITLDADATAPMRSLVSLCPTQVERLAEIRFIQGQLIQQVTRGDGVLEFAEIARPYLPSLEMLDFLRDGHSQRPDLWQNGVTLAAHLRNHGSVAESIEVMTAVCQCFPLLPRVWLELGQCYGAVPDREKQIQALTRVREMSPAWGWGMRTLADALRRDGRYAEAMEVLRQAIRYSPTDAWNFGWLAELLWHVGEKAPALDSLKKAVELEPGYDWAWNALSEWGPIAGQPSAARVAAENLVNARPAEARSWLALANVLTDATDFSARLKAVDRAITAAPHSFAGYEEKARLLALAGRYDEALAACAAGPAVPRSAILIAREAWVLWTKLDRKSAITKMEEALSLDEGLVWGWRLLADWHLELENTMNAEEVLYRLSRLEPENVVHLGLLAEIRRKKRDTEGVVELLSRALRMSPSYEYALNGLIEYHYGRGDYGEVRRLIDESKPHYSRVDFDSRCFVWQWRQRQFAEAARLLPGLFIDSEDGIAASERILAELKNRPNVNYNRRILKALEKSIISGEPRCGADGYLYVILSHSLNRVPKWRVVRRLTPQTRGGLLGLLRYIESIAERLAARPDDILTVLGENGRLYRLLRHRRDMLRSNDETWGTVGYALQKMEKLPETVKWLSDWRDRPGLEPYMLNNLFFSLQRLGREEESLEVMDCCLQLPRHDEIKMRLHLFAALYAALESRSPEARAHLSVVHEESLGGWGNATLHLVRTLMEYQPDCPKRRFGGDTRRVLSDFLASNRKNRTCVRLARRACFLIGRHNHSWFPSIWFFAIRYRVWLVTAGLIASIQIIRASARLFEWN